MVTLLLSALVAWLLIKNTDQAETKFINVEEVYSKFQLKIELMGEYESVEQGRTSHLDSIKLVLQTISNNAELASKEDLQKKYELTRQEYLYKKDQFESVNKELYQKYFDQIWTQLNQYIEEYGQKMQYKYLLGATGSGAIMYADESTNVTKDLIQFVNQKYAGK